MAKYKKKITTPLSYSSFRDTVEGHTSARGKDLTDQRKAFLNVLFFAGCRISEALALSATPFRPEPEFRVQG